VTAEILRSTFPGRAVHYFESIDSTMTAAAGRPIGTLVVANAQTAGQGRHGHSWHSEPGNGLYCSLVLASTPLLTLALGLATADAIAVATGIACDLRWPNDVLIEGKKVAGILVQASAGCAIGGIGINVNHSGFPPELADLATSLYLQSGRSFAQLEILRELVPAVERFTRFEPADTLRLFAQASSYVSGRRVVVDQPGGMVEGVTAGMDPSGYLVVRRDDGTDTLILAGGVRAARS
jgi:BirA family transcriptional regulator, biotin operon repressor / biotin---[acetyl-CoA-carboxylase] ligase